MRYGLPYQGSKNAIARKIVDFIPKSDCFVDLFFGGGAITHAAMVSGKFKRFIVNDIREEMIELFLDAIDGKFANEKRWISREEFFDMKDTDTYVSVCWSFANDRRTYLYGKHLEPYKKAYWYARVYGDFSLFEEMGIYVKGDNVGKYIKDNTADVRRLYIEYMGKHYDISDSTLERLQSLERLESLQSLERLHSLQSLERLQSLQSLQSLESLETNFGDYREVSIPSNCVIYCDPPYANTHKYIGDEFNHKEFFSWCLEQTQPILISEYNMPEPFVCVKEMNKMSLMSASSNHWCVERLFTTPKHIDFFRSNQLELF